MKSVRSAVCDQVSILRPHISQHVLRVDQSTSVDVLPDSRSVHYDLPADGTVFIGGLPAADRGTGSLRGAQPAPSLQGRRGQQFAAGAPPPPPPPYLPKQLRSRGLGFQGCLGSVDLNGDRWRLSERRDGVPVEHRDDIVEGCHGTFDTRPVCRRITRPARPSVRPSVCLSVTNRTDRVDTVSYTHLTLPTILRV